MTRDPSRFTTLLRGGAGVGGVYDAVAPHARGAAGRTRFTAAHGRAAVMILAAAWFWGWRRFAAGDDDHQRAGARRAAAAAAPPSVAILIPARNEEQGDRPVRRGGAREPRRRHRGRRARRQLDRRHRRRWSAPSRRAIRGCASLQAPRAAAGLERQAACLFGAGVTLTDKPFLLFLDADVVLAPEAAARLAPPEPASTS